jgi:hypothetical protein
VVVAGRVGVARNMRQARGRQRATERACQCRQCDNRGKGRDPALAEHSLVRLGFRFRTNIVMGPGAITCRHDHDPAGRARRVDLGRIARRRMNVGGVNLMSISFGRVQFRGFGGWALLRHQLGGFDLGRSWRGFLRA